MLPIPPTAGPSLHPKFRVVQPLCPTFTSSPVRTSLKKPIFKGKSPLNTSRHLQTSDFEDKEGRITSLPKEAEAGLLKQKDTFCEVEEKADAVTALPDCEEEHPAAASAPEDEDEIIFTPELFESKDNCVGPQNEFPPRTRNPATCLNELFEQDQGQASFNGQRTISVSKRKKPQGEKEGFRGQKKGVDEGQVENQSRKTDSWHRRVSRSGQNIPSDPTGK